MTAPRRLQLRRGNTAAVSAYVGAPGELVINTDTNAILVHNGSTVGGIPVTTNTAAITSNVSALQSNVSTLTANAGAQAGSIATLTSNAAVQAGLIADLQANAGAQAGSIATLTSNAASQAGFIATLQSDVTTLTANAGAQAGSIATLTGNAAIQAGLIADLQSNAATQAGLLASLNFYNDSNVASYLGDHTAKTFGGNVSIQGNLFVNGNISYVNTNSYVVSDNIVQFADSNPNDSLDLGFVAHRTVDGTLQHTGLIRDASDGRWKLFSNVVPQVGSTVDFTNAVYDELVLGNISSPTITNITSNLGAVSGSLATLTANAGAQAGLIADLQSNAAVQAGDIATLFANAGAQAGSIATLTSNAAAQSGDIATIYANLGGVAGSLATLTSNAAVQAGLIANVQGTYSNSNVASYLPTYSGNLSAGGYVGIAGQDGTTVVDFQTGAGTNQIISLGSDYTFNIKAGNGAGNRGHLVLESGQNSRVVIHGNGSNVQVTAGNGTSSGTWTFNTNGNLTLPSNIAAINYANGVSILSGLGSGGTTYSNTNVAAYLTTANITTTGNITAAWLSGNISITGNVVGTSPNVTIQAGSYSSTFNNQGNVILPNLAVSGNVISGGYFLGNGALLTGIVSGGASTYSNTNVAAYLTTGINTAAPQIQLTNATSNFIKYNNVGVGAPTFITSNVGTRIIYWSSVDANTADYAVGIDAGVLWHGIPRATSGFAFKWYAGTTQIASLEGTGNLAVSGNVSATNFIGNGALLTGIVSGGGTTYSNSNVASYLPTYSGNVSAAYFIGNLTNATGNVYTVGNIIVGVSGYTVLPTTIAQFTGNANTYTQLNIQNISTGTDATSEYVATANNGTDTTFFVDMGIANSNYDVNSPNNSLGTAIFANDSYLYAQGNTAATVGGNLVIGTTTANKSVKIFAGGINSGNIVATVANTGVSVTGNITATNNITATGNVTATYIVTTGGFGNITQVDTITANNVVATANVTVQGMGVTMPNRPAFRIYGNGSTNWTTANTNFKGSSIVVDYNQGSYFNSTTGVFTAPVAGLYSVTLTARIGNNNGQNQIMVIKNNQTSAGNVAVMWECDTNTGTAVHYGVSSMMRLVAGDFLTANITVGSVQFDANDSWTVTYLG